MESAPTGPRMRSRTSPESDRARRVASPFERDVRPDADSGRRKKKRRKEKKRKRENTGREARKRNTFLLPFPLFFISFLERLGSSACFSLSSHCFTDSVFYRVRYVRTASLVSIGGRNSPKRPTWFDKSDVAFTDIAREITWTMGYANENDLGTPSKPSGRRQCSMESLK